MKRHVAALLTLGLVCLSSDTFAGERMFRHWHFSGCRDCQLCDTPGGDSHCEACCHRMRHESWEAGCACGAAAATCCGHGLALWTAPIAGPASRHGRSRQWTGYEGLPNMDGGGVHIRYPYHSYRRPWFPPGPASTNITICW